ncbi:hypothetical protein KZ349_06320, partial [Glaesserella parasuis]|nr:hypothetical protein [Glaesserella parasuis]MCT8688110.1 hypothetical protein [Glaesserella parasuis]MDE4008714.1 hypothetical protein [Glaesserella parasuis]
GFADEVIHAYATERVLALGTPKLWITLWFMLLVYYNFNIQGTPRLVSFEYVYKIELKWTPGVASLLDHRDNYNATVCVNL